MEGFRTSSHISASTVHTSSTGSSPVSRICIKPPQRGMGKRENQPNLLQEQYSQPPALSNKRIFHSQKSQTLSSRSAPRESYFAIPKLQLRAGAGRSLPGPSILSLHSVLRCGLTTAWNLEASLQDCQQQKQDTFTQEHPFPMERSIITSSTSTKTSCQASCLNPSRK